MAADKVFCCVLFNVGTLVVLDGGRKVPKGSNAKVKCCWRRISTGVNIKMSAADWNGIWRVETLSCFAAATAVKIGNAGDTMSTPEVNASRIAS